MLHLQRNDKRVPTAFKFESSAEADGTSILAIDVLLNQQIVLDGLITISFESAECVSTSIDHANCFICHTSFR